MLGNTRPYSLLVVFSLLLLLLGSASMVLAQSPEDQDLAVELFERGAKAYKSGDFANAIDWFNNAYELDPDPVILYNLARAYDGDGQLQEAEKIFNQLIADDNAPQEIKDRAQTELIRYANRKSSGQLQINSLPSGAKVFINGEDTGETTPYQSSFDTGNFIVVLKLEGYQDLQEAFSIAKDETTNLNLELQEGSGLSGLYVASFVSLGVGAAGLITGVAMYFPAQSALDDYNADKTNEAAKSDGEMYAIISNIGYGVGAVGLVAGLGLLTWALLDDEEDTPSAANGLLPDALAVDPISGQLALGWSW